MKKLTRCLESFLIVFSIGFQQIALGQQIVVNTDKGESYFIEIDPMESLESIVDRVAFLSEDKFNTNHLLIEVPLKEDRHFCAMHPSRNQGKLLKDPRNYNLSVTTEEAHYIRMIVVSLANRSLFSLAIPSTIKELEEAGDRIDHVHPLRFLMTVFTDEELKVGIRNIRKRGMVWGHFIGGLKTSLANESMIGNMRDEYIEDFARTVKIDPKLIMPSIKQQNWDEFVNLLIQHIPRAGDHGRYDG